jgi:hypothetical protein
MVCHPHAALLIATAPCVDGEETLNGLQFVGPQEIICVGRYYIMLYCMLFVVRVVVYLIFIVFTVLLMEPRHVTLMIFCCCSYLY